MPPRRRHGQTELFVDLRDAPTSGPGPVYQGVCKQIRTLIESEIVDRNAQAGTVAQARSIAKAVDVASGHTGLQQASGMQLAALHAQLDALLARLSGSPVERDPFADFLDEINTDDRNAPAPHPEV